MSDIVLLIDAISKLMWPVISLILLIIIYKPLKEMLKNINDRNIKVKVGDNEIEIGEYIKQQTTLISEIQKENIDKEEINLTKNTNETIANDQTNQAKKIRIYRANKAKISENKILKNRILWVDDNPTNNAALFESLRSQGYNIDISLSTADSLQRLSKKTYDLVISDMGRLEKGINNSTAGIDLAKQIRFDNREMPIIIFTSSNGIHRITKEQQELSLLFTSSGAELLRMVYENTIT